MMLRLEKATLGQFGSKDMMGLIALRGWEAVLPDALDDNHLLLVSGQLRDILSGVGWNENHDSARVALHLTLLFLSKAGARHSGDSIEVGLETLQEAFCLLSTAFDREIVNRMLQRKDSTSIGVGVIRGLEMLIQNAQVSAEATCHA